MKLFKGFCRGLAFTMIIALITGIQHGIPSWLAGIMGGIMAFCAFWGWIEREVYDNN